MKFLKFSFIFWAFFSHALFSQLNYLPYKLEFSSIVYSEYPMFEGHVFNKTETVLIGCQLRPLPGYPEFRISDKMYGFIDNIMANSEYPEISAHLYVVDIDNDGLDEIVIPFIGKKTIKFLLYDYKNGKAEITEIFKLKLTEKEKTRYNFNYSHININNSKEDILLINLNSSYPKIGSIRGVFAIDIKAKKQLWYYPTADYCTAFALESVNDDYIIIASSSVSNGVAFSNNTFFKVTKKGTYKPYKTAYTKINSMVLDTTATDYSTDETADLICIDKTGKKVWEKKFGENFVWGAITQDEGNIIYCPKHRYSKDTVKSRLFLINPANGDILKEKKIRENKVRGFALKEKRIFINFINDLSDVYDYNFNKLNKEPIKKCRISDYFKTDGKYFYLGLAFDNKSNYTVVYNENFELVAKSKSNSYQPFYFPSIGKIVRYEDKNQHTLYSLVYIPWYMRISPSQLWRYSFIISLLLILLIFSWGYSHYKASKTIKEQKLKLEKTTSELIRKEKLSVLGTIASSVAHELNSPLGAILNSAQRILKRNKLEEFDRENAQLIESATISCKTIVHKFLAASKPNEQIVGCYLGEATNNWLKLYGRQLSSTNILLITNIEKNCYLRINNVEMHQIINNLISNARFQLVNVNIIDKKIFIASERYKDYCRITFEDNGGGFSEEVFAHKFKAFYTTKQEGQGTGLGLWTVKKIIDNINGKIEITNSEKGAKITIDIPLFINNKVS